MEGIAVNAHSVLLQEKQLLDNAGVVEARYKYTAFGEVSAVSLDGSTWSALAMEGWSSLTAGQWATMSVMDWAELPLELSSQMLAGEKLKGVRYSNRR